MEIENKGIFSSPVFETTNNERKIEIPLQGLDNSLMNNEIVHFSEILQNLESDIEFIRDINIPLIIRSIQDAVTFSVQSMETSIKAIADALIESVANIKSAAMGKTGMDLVY